MKAASLTGRWLVQPGSGDQLELSDLSQVQGLPDVLKSLFNELYLMSKSLFTCYGSPLRDLSEPSFSQSQTEATDKLPSSYILFSQ